MNKLRLLVLLVFFVFSIAEAQYISLMPVKSVYQNIYVDPNNYLYINCNNLLFSFSPQQSKYSLSQLRDNIYIKGNNIYFNFSNPFFSGKLFYSLLLSNQPVNFVEKEIPIVEGIAQIDIKRIEKQHNLNISNDTAFYIVYRVIDNQGNIIYDGKTSIRKNKDIYMIDVAIVEGPFCNNVTDTSFKIDFTTNFSVITMLKVNDKIFADSVPAKKHSFFINKLKPNTVYTYTIIYGNNHNDYTVKTYPRSGSRQQFSFAWLGDSRKTGGGGEYNVYGVNKHTLTQCFNVIKNYKASFAIFGGDMIDGYSHSVDDVNLQYANWRIAIEQFAHSLPIYTVMGNHESVFYRFDSPQKSMYIPFFTNINSEKLFYDNVFNPSNGPFSEDNSFFDIDSINVDFPLYDRSVYWFSYDNTAFIVLNTEYMQNFDDNSLACVGGNIHGYIMDNQLQWLQKTIEYLDNNKNIDNIFICQHAPTFPVSKHVADAMWYNGDNTQRPYINNKVAERGIIEQRDKYLSIINKSNKFVAILASDEHNVSVLKISEKSNIYPDGYKNNKININRSILQIVNGAAGAPLYYNIENIPWKNDIVHFSTHNAVCLFDVKGKEINLKVINPITSLEIFNYRIK